MSKPSNHGNEGPEHETVQPAQPPYWKRAHRDFRFWIGLILMLTAITIYVLSDDLALLPRQPVSGAVGR